MLFPTTKLVLVIFKINWNWDTAYGNGLSLYALCNELAHIFSLDTPSPKLQQSQLS